MIKAVIFDIDGVLIDSLEANYQYYLHLFKMFGKPFVSRQVYKDKIEGLTMKTILNKMIRFTGTDLEEKFEFVKKTAPHFSEFYKVPEGEQDAIKKLSKKYKLALVTSRYSVNSVFSTIGLKDYFPVVVKFGDYKEPKPNPESLIIALKKLQVRANEAIYVGDRESDLLAARSAGMKFIGFPLYSGKKLEGSDVIFMNFAELPNVIDKLSKD